MRTSHISSIDSPLCGYWPLHGEWRVCSQARRITICSYPHHSLFGSLALYRISPARSPLLCLCRRCWLGSHHWDKGIAQESGKRHRPLGKEACLHHIRASLIYFQAKFRAVCQVRAQVSIMKLQAFSAMTVSLASAQSIIEGASFGHTGG